MGTGGMCSSALPAGERERGKCSAEYARVATADNNLPTGGPPVPGGLTSCREASEMIAGTGVISVTGASPQTTKGAMKKKAQTPAAAVTTQERLLHALLLLFPHHLKKKPAPSTGCLEYTVECLLVKTRKHWRPATNVHNIDNKSMATTKQSSRDTHGQFFQLNKQQGYQPCQATSTPQEHSQGQTEIRSHHAKKRKGGGGEPHRAHASFRKPYANVKNRRGKPVNAASGTQLPLSPPHIQNV